MWMAKNHKSPEFIPQIGKKTATYWNQKNIKTEI